MCNNAQHSQLVRLCQLLFLVLRFFIFGFALGNKTSSEFYERARTLRLAIPARTFCDDPDAFVDFSLRSCVLIDRSVRQLPFFSCPEGTILEERQCVGRLESDVEHGCPSRYGLNEHAQCTKATTYVPPEVVCPDGFKFHHDRRTQTNVCVKHSWLDVLYTDENKPSPYTAQCENDTQYPNGCSPPAKALCPNGYRLIRNPPSGTTQSLHQSAPENGVGAEAARHTAKAMCFSRIVVPPQPRKLCLKRFRWSHRLAGCLKLEAVTATNQCPKPDIHIGYGKGDWDTPTFHYDPQCGTCTASSAPALHPQCPPGWALEGLTTPTCFRKRFTPIHYDCQNADGGFQFRWNPELKIGECEITIDMSQFSPGASYLTRRSEINGKYLNLASRPWTLLKGFEDGVVTEETEVEEEAKEAANQQKGKAEARAIAGQARLAAATLTAADFTDDETKLLQQILNNTSPGLQMPFDTTTAAPPPDPALEFDSITAELIPSAEAPLVRGRLRRSIAWRSFDAFHTGLPGTREDLLEPRSPGSFSASFDSPMSIQKKLHIYAKKRGIF